MQTNANKITELDASARSSYPPVLKDQALKLLLDYSNATGKKWQSIRDEIMRLVGQNASESAPLLTRQNLESWARRGTRLSDDKFRFVYAFLTHPETQVRAEFKRAKHLTSFQRIEDVGRNFEDFFNDAENSGFIHRTPERPELEADEIDRRMAAFEGVFLADSENDTFALSLKRYTPWFFYIAHFMSWPNDGLDPPRDWNIDRYSGFAVIGNRFRVWARGVTIPTVRDLYLMPKGDYRKSKVDHLILLRDTFFDQATQNILFDSFDAAHKRLSYVDPLHHKLDFERTNDVSLQKLVDKFEWNLPL